jgi:hypothetical protein
VDARLPGRVAQEFEVQLGDRNLGGAAMAARKRVSRVWKKKIEEEGRKGEKVEEVA